jgi:hypothetical protein
VKDPALTRFLYRDLLWNGADMIGLGVASLLARQRHPFSEPTRLGPLHRQCP